VAIHPTSGRAYVTNSGSGTLSVIDLGAHTVIAEIPVGRAPGIVVLDPGISRAFVSDYDAASVAVVDLDTNRLITTLPVGGLGLAVDTSTHTVYAAGGRTLALIDGPTATIYSVPAPDSANVWGLAVDPATSRVFATDLAAPRVLVLDGRGAFVSSIRIPDPARFGITFDAASHQLLVATYVKTAARLVAIDPVGGRVAWQTPVGSLPFAIAVDPSAGTAHVSALGDNAINSVSLSTRALFSTLSSGRAPMGLAVQPGTRRVLVVSADDATLAEGK
jgi:YVTN family beta-propeller protein